MIETCPTCGQVLEGKCSKSKVNLQVVNVPLILNAVERASWETGKVYPADITEWVGYKVRRLRDIMDAIAAEGKLIRVGLRGGYRLPDAS
jgi:hypothetical protein